MVSNSDVTNVSKASRMSVPIVLVSVSSWSSAWMSASSTAPVSSNEPDSRSNEMPWASKSETSESRRASMLGVHAGYDRCRSLNVRSSDWNVSATLPARFWTYCDSLVLVCVSRPRTYSAMPATMTTGRPIIVAQTTSVEPVKTNRPAPMAATRTTMPPIASLVRVSELIRSLR